MGGGRRGHVLTVCQGITKKPLIWASALFMVGHVRREPRVVERREVERRGLAVAQGGARLRAGAGLVMETE